MSSRSPWVRLIENYYMVETPTRYKPILKAFKLGGYGSFMGASTGQGAGMQWRQNVDLVKQHSTSQPTTWLMVVKVQKLLKKGMFGEDTDGLFLSQVGYGNTQVVWICLCTPTNKVMVQVPAMGYSTPAASNYGRSSECFRSSRLLVT